MNLALIALLACESPPLQSEDDARAEIEAAEPARRLMLIEAHVSQNPDSANAHLWLARAYRERDDARAVEQFDKAIALAPTEPIPRVEKAYLSLEPSLRHGVDPDAATLDAAKALIAPVAGDGASCETRHHLAGVYDIELSAGRVDDGAEAWLLTAMAACPKEAPNWRATLGRWYRAKGDLERASEALCGSVKDGNAVAASDCVALASDGKEPWTPDTVGEWMARGHLAADARDLDAACPAFAAGARIDSSGAAEKAALARGCKP